MFLGSLEKGTPDLRRRNFLRRKENTLKEIKKAKNGSSIAGLIDALERKRTHSGEGIGNTDEISVGNNASAGQVSADNARDPFNEAALRLGSAMLRRLNVSEDDDASDLVDAILGYWENEPSARSIREKTVQRHRARQASRKKAEPLPRPIRADITEAPEADYENMSSEQFRKLKKQLQRAALNGRRIRL